MAARPSQVPHGHAGYILGPNEATGSGNRLVHVPAAHGLYE
jgi:hypothetical protein